MVCSDFGAQGNKNRHRFHIFLFYLPWSDGTGCMILIFFNVEFQISLFTFCFNLLKSLFSFSSLSAIRVVLSAYLRLLMPYPLFEIWCVSIVSKLWHAYTFFFYSSTFSFLRTFWLFSIVAVPIYIPTNSKGVFPYLNTFSNICCLLIFLIIAILTNLRWHLIIVLIYISLITSWQKWGNNGNSDRLYFLGLQNQWTVAAWN